MVFGIIVIFVYIGFYVNENFIKRIKKNERRLQEFSKEINNSSELQKLKERISYLEGKMSVKNKKGQMNPILLIIIILILILLILWLKEKGIV